MQKSDFCFTNSNRKMEEDEMLVMRNSVNWTEKKMFIVFCKAEIRNQFLLSQSFHTYAVLIYNPVTYSILRSGS